MMKHNYVDVDNNSKCHILNNDREFYGTYQGEEPFKLFQL